MRLGCAGRSCAVARTATSERRRCACTEPLRLDRRGARSPWLRTRRFPIADAPRQHQQHLASTDCAGIRGSLRPVESGAGIEYSYRWGPLTLRGQATALEAQAPGHLRVRWKHQLLGDAIAEFTLEPLHSGTSVRISERPMGMFAATTTIPVLGALGESNYSASLARLERYAHRRPSTANSEPSGNAS
jgi:hypothetical protein